tara:strand:+ start:535 stop:705 length:171 start_codon:yes stop_codon:yes gene_type:complete
MKLGFGVLLVGVCFLCGWIMVMLLSSGMPIMLKFGLFIGFFGLILLVFERLSNRNH